MDPLEYNRILSIEISDRLWYSQLRYKATPQINSLKPSKSLLAGSHNEHILNKIVILVIISAS